MIIKLKISEAKINHPSKNEVDLIKKTSPGHRYNPYDGQFSSETDRDEAVANYEKKIRNAEARLDKASENSFAMGFNGYDKFHEDKEKIGYMYDRLSLMKSARVESIKRETCTTESKRRKRVKESPGHFDDEDQEMYYARELNNLFSGPSGSIMLDFLVAEHYYCFPESQSRIKKTWDDEIDEIAQAACDEAGNGLGETLDGDHWVDALERRINGDIRYNELNEGRDLVRLLVKWCNEPLDMDELLRRVRLKRVKESTEIEFYDEELFNKTWDKLPAKVKNRFDIMWSNPYGSKLAHRNDFLNYCWALKDAEVLTQSEVDNLDKMNIAEGNYLD